MADIGYTCPERGCADKHDHIVEQIARYERGERVDGINIPLFFHVSSELIERFFDTVLTRGGVGIKHIVACAGLSDRVGFKIARLIEISNDLETVAVSYNNFTIETLRAVAYALWSNKSVRDLTINFSQTCTRSQLTDELFARALKINPDRPRGSKWIMTGAYIPVNDYEAIEAKARALPHPTLQQILFPYLGTKTARAPYIH